MAYYELINFGISYIATIIVNITHPYAKIVSDNVKDVAKELELSYIRYIRKTTEKSSNTFYLSNYEESYDYLSKINSTVFLQQV